MREGEDDFRPRLGRIRARGGKASKRYLGRLYAAIEKARPGAFAKRGRSRFSGARIGRGAGLGAAFRFHDPFASSRARRVAVKIRSVRLGANGLPKARAHLNYIQRDGTDRDGAPGRLYGPQRDVVEASAFLEEGKDDRHQFRIILAPEDAGELADLSAFTRAVMAEAQKDLGTKLDWVAVNHFNTDHPHTHVVLRGKTADGADLVIAKNYITHGLRRRAEELATLELGQRTDLNIAKARAAEVEKERFTGLDRDLVERAEAGNVVLARPRSSYERFRIKLLLARLKRLEAMGLAQRSEGSWRLSADLEPALKELARRGDIIRSMGEALGPRLSPAIVRDFEASGAPEKIIGRVAGSGAADDGHDLRFIAVDGADGRQWRIVAAIPLGAAPPIGAVIEARKEDAAPKRSDLVITRIASRHDGVYSDALHAREDPRAGEAFRLAHKRRLEAMRRLGLVAREKDGSWRIPADYLRRAARVESERSARLRVLSWVGLEGLADARAATFLDDHLERKVAIEAAVHGFGAELAAASAARRRWLLAEGLARETDGAFLIDRHRLRGLERAATTAAAAKIAKELGKPFAAISEGDRIQGIYRRPIDLPSGRFALIEKAKDFTLLPWRDALEQRRGLAVSGVLTRGGFSWEIGPRRGGPAR